MPLQLVRNVLFPIVKHAYQVELFVLRPDVLQILSLSKKIVVKFLLRVVMLCLKVLHALADIFFVIKLA
jgi:hypothetical protein